MCVCVCSGGGGGNWRTVVLFTKTIPTKFGWNRHTVRIIKVKTKYFVATSYYYIDPVPTKYNRKNSFDLKRSLPNLKCATHTKS